MNITPNPNNLDSSIIDNKDLVVLLTTHLEYVKSLRNNIFVKLKTHEIEFLDNKTVKLTNKIGYLKSKLSVEDLQSININN
jgi:uncharacterized protein YeeX (DUF496 family)